MSYTIPAPFVTIDDAELEEKFDQSLRALVGKEFETIRQRFSIPDPRALKMAQKRVAAVVAEIVADECEDLASEWTQTRMDV